MSRRAGRALLAGGVCALGLLIPGPAVASAPIDVGTLRPTDRPPTVVAGSDAQSGTNLEIVPPQPPGGLGYYPTGTQFVLSVHDAAGQNCLAGDDLITFDDGALVTEGGPAQGETTYPTARIHQRCTSSDSFDAIEFVLEKPSSSTILSNLAYTIGSRWPGGPVSLDLTVTCALKCSPTQGPLPAACSVSPCSNATVAPHPDLEPTALSADDGADDDHVRFEVGVTNVGGAPSIATPLGLSGVGVAPGASGTVTPLAAGEFRTVPVDVAVDPASRGSRTIVNVVIDPAGDARAREIEVALPKLPPPGSNTTSSTTGRVVGRGAGVPLVPTPSTDATSSTTIVEPSIVAPSHRRNLVEWIGSSAVVALALLAGGTAIARRGRNVESKSQPPRPPAVINVALGPVSSQFVPRSVRASIRVALDGSQRSIAWKKGSPG